MGYLAGCIDSNTEFSDALPVGGYSVWSCFSHRERQLVSNFQQGKQIE